MPLERKQFAAIGTEVTIHPMAKLVYPDRIEMGSHVIIDDFAFLVAGPRMRIGNYVHIASFVSVTGGGDFIIEDFAGISAGTRIVTGTDDFDGGSLTGPTVPPEFRRVVRSFVHIGRHAIIGTNVVVHPGVTIGQGAAVGSCSLVTGDVPPWTVAWGVPCRPVRARQSETILRLENELRQREMRGAPDSDV